MNPIAARRLFSQQIEQPRCTTPMELVRWMGAVQGQDYPGGLWTVGLRLPKSSEQDVEAGFLRREIVRTWALRGTLHFVAASDIHWMLDLQGRRQIARNARRYRELELDEQTMLRSNRILLNALEGSEKTRRALLRILEDRGISTKAQRAPYLLQRASLDGLICQGVTKRNDPTYMLLPEAGTTPISRDDAAAELAKRYFLSHGPATLQDFIWWSGLPAAEARAGLEGATPQLVSEPFGGIRYWMSPNLLQRSGHSPTAYLLSAFDEYLVSYRKRDAAIDADQAHRVLIGKPTILVNGRVAGTWTRLLKEDRVIITISFFRSLNEAEHAALEGAIARFGRFIQKEPQWQQ